MFCFTRKVWLKRRGLLSTKKLILIVGAVGAAIAATSTLRGIETTSNRATNIDENMVTGNNAHFTLCDRDVYLENMPRLPSDLEFGFPRSAWRRNQTYAILMDSAFLYGRTGNHVREFFHAFDMARDGSRALIVEERGLPIDIPLNELFAGLRRSHLEEALGLAFYGDVPERHRETLVSVRGGQLVQYKGAYPLQERIDHRNYVLRELYRLTAKEMELHPNSPFARGMCQSLNTLFGSDKQDTPGSKHIGTEKYTVIHSRSFEGNGYKLLEGDSEAYNIDPRAMIDFPPDLILAILSPLGMVNSSMVMISDGQNASVAERLSSHPTIGPHFRVVPRENSTMLGDMMLAILGDVFVGNPVSTYSHYIALVRYALGIGPSYMHARRKEDGEWETFCEDVKCFHELHKP